MCVFLHFFLIRNIGQVEITHAPTLLASYRQIAQGIRGIIHGAITVPGEGFPSVRGINNVAIAFPVNRIHCRQAGCQYCLRVSPRITLCRQR